MTSNDRAWPDSLALSRRPPGESREGEDEEEEEEEEEEEAEPSREA